MSIQPRRRILIAVALAAVAVAGLLALDLAARGLAWRALYAVTGEERPLAQMRGLVEWLGNALRPPLDLALDVPVNHADVNPFGVNTFLEQEVEPAKRERQMQMIAEAGFRWIRQQFVWEDIEIHANDDYVDVRNDPAGVDAWAKYDMIVDLAERYGVQIQARLGNPPQWAQAVPGDFAPPANPDDFADFARVLAERYRGRIQYYQVWNEPNIYPEWGEQAVDPEAFTALLCRVYDALKAVDPQIVVIAPALSPTLALTGRDLNEFIYLQRMYDAGAGRCFDVAAAQGYGFFSGPSDQRLNVFHQNFGRQQFLLDLMVHNGDASKALWISEAAWNPSDAPEVAPDVTAREAFGVVTREQAAAYLTQAYGMVEQQWPYVGVMNTWFFKLPSEDRRGQSWYYFRMLEPDFTPLPVYDALRDYLSTHQSALYRGVHQGEHWAIRTADDAATITADGAQFERALQTTRASFRAVGTALELRLQGGPVRVSIDGAPVTPTAADEDGWSVLQLPLGLVRGAHEITLEADAPFLLASVAVRDSTPSLLVGAAALLAGAAGLAAVWAWRRWRR